MNDTNDLAAVLAHQESSREENLRNIRKKSALVGIIAAVIGAALVILLPGNEDDSSPWMIPLVLAAIVTFLAHKTYTKRFKATLKTETIPLLLRSVDPSLGYQASGAIGRDQFKTAEIFKKKWDNYEGQDLVTGQIGQTKVQFCMLKLTVTDRDIIKTDNSSGEQTVTLFEGLLFVADFNKHFSARTFINQETDSLISDVFGHTIELEDPEFNRLFTVRSTDETEARYLLSPTLMERLKALRKRGHFRAAFFQGNLWLMLEMPMGAFDPDLSKPLTDAAQTLRVIENLKSITGMVEELDLNTRIWSKA